MPTTLKLPCDLVIDDAKSIAAQWMALIAGCKDAIIVDATDTQNADTAGMQLLLALAKQASANNLELEIHRPSARILTMLRVMGLSSRFKIAS